LAERFDRFALLHRWNFQQPSTCEFQVEPCSVAPEKLAKAVEDTVRSNCFAPEDFTAFIIAAAQRGETMRQVLAQLREPPARPDQDVVPYLGDNATCEQAILATAKDLIALKVGNTWFRADPGETVDQANSRLKRCCFKTGRELDEVQLGLPSQVGAGGVSVPPQVATPPGGLFSPTGTAPTSVSSPATGGTVVTQPPGVVQTPVTTAAPVILQSNGAKSGINLLGDIERWALPDHDRITLATLTLRGLTVKELRELCTKLPSKLQAELQITSNPEQLGRTGQ
jgi:hypothetical protein